MLGAALTVGVTPVEVKEIVYQAVPYVGMAKVFDFLHATNEVLTERGVALPLPGPVDHHARDPGGEGPGGAGAGRRGRRCRRHVRQRPGDELHIQRYLSANCFGDHLTRTGLDLPTRELVTFSHPRRPRRLRPAGQGSRRAAT